MKAKIFLQGPLFAQTFILQQLKILLNKVAHATSAYIFENKKNRGLKAEGIRCGFRSTLSDSVIPLPSTPSHSFCHPLPPPPCSLSPILQSWLSNEISTSIAGNHHLKVFRRCKIEKRFLTIEIFSFVYYCFWDAALLYLQLEQAGNGHVVCAKGIT